MAKRAAGAAGLSFRLASELAASGSFERAGLLEGLDERACIAAADAFKGKLCDFADGDAIVDAGSRSSAMWVVSSGHVEARDRAGGLIGRWKAPCVVGETGLLDASGFQPATVVADGRVEAVEIGFDALERLEAAGLSSAFWRNIASAVSRRAMSACAGRNAAEPGSTKRLDCVVLFTDIVGFSAMARLLDDDDTALLLARAMARQGEAIEARGGRIDKMMGDGLMAYWEIGPGLSRAAACKSALAAAVEAAIAVSGVPDPTRPGRGVALRVGMHVGQAVHGDFGSGRVGGRTLIGECVNVACRMEQARSADGAGHGPLGSVRCSEDFHAELDEVDRLVLAQEAFVTMKGQAYKVRSGTPAIA